MKRLIFAVAAVMAAFALSPVQAATFTWYASDAGFLAGGGCCTPLPGGAGGGGTIQADYLGGDQYLATAITGTFAGAPITGLAHTNTAGPIDDMLVPMTANQGIAFTVDDGTLDGLLYQIYPVFVFDPSAHNAGRTDTFALYAVDPVSFDGGGIGTVSFGVDLVTPIPGALPLFATGLAGLAWLARRRRKPTA